jgi:hypothetical protein
MAITPLPTPPSRDDAANFSDRADAFLGALPTFVTETNALAADIDDSADAAAASANSALNAPGTNATSTASVTIGMGSKTFPIQTGKAFAKGQTMVAAYNGAPNTQMQGVIIAHDPVAGSVTINVDATSGTGTYADWTLSLTAGVPRAVAADVRALTDPTKVITPKALGDAMGWTTFTDAATITINLANGMKQYGVLGGARTFGAPTGMVDGQPLHIEFDCNGYMPAWASGTGGFDWGLSGAPLPITTAGKIHYVYAEYVAHRSKWVANYRPPA